MLKLKVSKEIITDHTMEASSTTNSRSIQITIHHPSETTQKTTPHEEKSALQFPYNQSLKSSKTTPHKEKLLMDPSMENAVDQASVKEYSGREKLKRHWNEVAGKILIPERWGREGFLKEWVDYSSFDAVLAPNGVVSAREALVAEARTSFKKGCS
ncbi:hypothetical protein Adt_16691 [Abeliophyllum distichum]|uniref:Uncharacterized protein n=1 Tax=Abeliophyllum distichum TaxID=126358 RepID=A0ABD1TEG7_9LAMI